MWIAIAYGGSEGIWGVAENGCKDGESETQDGCSHPAMEYAGCDVFDVAVEARYGSGEACDAADESSTPSMGGVGIADMARGRVRYAGI